MNYILDLSLYYNYNMIYHLVTHLEIIFNEAVITGNVFVLPNYNIM